MSTGTYAKTWLQGSSWRKFSHESHRSCRNTARCMGFRSGTTIVVMSDRGRLCSARKLRRAVREPFFAGLSRVIANGLHFRCHPTSPDTSIRKDSASDCRSTAGTNFICWALSVDPVMTRLVLGFSQGICTPSRSLHLLECRHAPTFRSRPRTRDRWQYAVADLCQHA